MTAQVPDCFEWEGARLTVCSGCGVPLKHPGIVRTGAWWLKEWPKSQDGVIDVRTLGGSTAIQRDYLARWAVHDGLLVLALLEGYYRLKDDKPVAVPFTGRFSLGTGKALLSMWAPEYTNHVYLDFTEGRLQAVSRD